jgi:hypothetical protein
MAVILIPDGNLKNFQAEINRLAKGKEMNSQVSRILKVGLLWLEQRNSQCRNKRIYLIISKKLRIYNSIIVSQKQYVINKVYSKLINVNDVDTGMKLGVYIWFPYQRSELFKEVKDITILDSWVIFAQGHLNKNTDFLHEKSVKASKDVL